MTERPSVDDLDRRFDVIRQLEVPDIWGRFAAETPAESPPSRWTRPALVLAVAACLAVLVAGVAAAIATRSDSNPVSLGEEPEVSTLECVDDCALADWDLVEAVDQRVGIVYFVDAGCPPRFEGVRLQETDASVHIGVLLAETDADSCTGEVLQRSTTVLLDTELADRDLTGCRNADAQIVRPPVDSCRSAITSVYRGTEVMRDQMAALNAAPPTTVAGEVWLAPIETEPVDIIEPGTYELLAAIDPARIADCSGLSYPSELEEFLRLTINPPTQTSDGLFEQRVIEGTTYLVVPLVVTEVVQPATNVVIWVC